MTEGELWSLVVAVLAGSAAAGLGVTLVLRRMMPTVPFMRTWLFYGVLMAALLAVVLSVGLS